MVVSSCNRNEDWVFGGEKAAEKEKGSALKEMIKRIREEKGGFTLAELLIVVAIILVLVAIAVPVFTGAMDDAKNATNQGNESTVKEVAVVSYYGAESKAAGSGAAAATGWYYIDANKDVIKGGTEVGTTATSPSGALDGPIYIKAVPPTGGTGDVKFTVSRSPIS